MRPHIAVLLGMVVVGACTAGEEVSPSGSTRDASADRALGTGGSTHTGGATSAGGSTHTGGATGTGGITGSGGATGTGGMTGSGGATGTGGTTGSGASTGTGGTPWDASSDGPLADGGPCSAVPVCDQSNWSYMFTNYRCSIGQLIWTCTTNCTNCGTHTVCCAPQQTGCPWAGVTWAPSTCY